NRTPTTETYTLSLHDALPISWVLWMDGDLADYPADIARRLLATGLDIVHPHCVIRPGGPSYDHNAWRDHGRVTMDRLRGHGRPRSEEHTSELQSRENLVCRLL